MSTQFSSIVGTPVSTNFVSEVGACSKAVLYHRIDGERCKKMKLLSACVRKTAGKGPGGIRTAGDPHYNHLRGRLSRRRQTDLLRILYNRKSIC